MYWVIIVLSVGIGATLIGWSVYWAAKSLHEWALKQKIEPLQSEDKKQDETPKVEEQKK
jgi:hypothetical protein